MASFTKIAGTAAAVGGVAIAAVSRFLPNFRVWRITNTDTGETLEGDFEATNVVRSVQARYTEQSSLNQAKPITQWLSGSADTLSFDARLYQPHAFSDITPKFNKLVSWCSRDPLLRRPPIVLVAFGNGDAAYFGNKLAVIDGINNAVFDQPTFLGAVRGVSFQLAIREYTPFSLENPRPPETRYARAKQGEYFELLAAREYGNPMLGDVVRQRTTMQIVTTGDVVKLPSLEAIHTIAVVPQSLPLRGLTSKKPSSQRTLREFHLERLTRPRTSLVVPEGL